MSDTTPSQAARRRSHARHLLVDAERRIIRVPVRMSAAEHADALACAEALSISLSRLLRSRAEALPPLRAKIDLETAAELGRIGNNLNQLVHLLHEGFRVRRDSLEALLLKLREEVEDIRWRLRE